MVPSERGPQLSGKARGWVFPSEASASGHLESIQHLNAPIGEAGGAKFRFYALHNCFIVSATTLRPGPLLSAKACR